jgi:hypothetical protein
MQWIDHNLFYDFLHLKVFECKFNLAVRLCKEI